MFVVLRVFTLIIKKYGEVFSRIFVKFSEKIQKYIAFLGWIVPGVGCS